MLYQQKDVLSYTSSIVQENIFSDIVTEKISFLWKTAKKFPEDKYKLAFKALKRDLIDQPDVGLCQRICDTKEGKSFYALLYLLYKNILRFPEGKIQINVLRLSLEEMKLNSSLIDIVLKNTQDTKAFPVLQEISKNLMIRRNQVVEINWDLNIALCSNLISKIMEPTVILRLKTNTDEIIVFEMNIRQFHNLRYQISAIMKAMIDYGQKGISK